MALAATAGRRRRAGKRARKSGKRAECRSSLDGRWWASEDGGWLGSVRRLPGGVRCAAAAANLPWAEFDADATTRVSRRQRKVWKLLEEIAAEYVGREGLLMPRVFLSHSTLDRWFVEGELLPTLHAHGVKVWYAPSDIHKSEEWERMIVQGLRSCDWFLVVLSENAVNSKWVRAEVHWAFDNRGGRIVPLFLRDCDTDDIHLQLRTVQFVDFRTDQRKGRDDLLAIWPAADQVWPKSCQPAELLVAAEGLVEAHANPAGPTITLEALEDGKEVGLRQLVSGSHGVDEGLNIYVLVNARDSHGCSHLWWVQREVTRQQGRFQCLCQFGEVDSGIGERFLIVAIATSAKYRAGETLSSFPSGVIRSREVVVTRSDR
jgi:hypothetical protein